MAAKKTVTVKILDQLFTMSTDASPEKVEKISGFLNQTLEDIKVATKSKSLSPYQMAVLAALNITGQYIDALERQSDFRSKVTEKSKKILGLLEENSTEATVEKTKTDQL